LSPMGSRPVAGWVAGWVAGFTLTYGFEGLSGSRCSSFLNKLRAKRKKRGRGRIGVTIGISCYTCYPGMQVDPLNVGGEA
jgi:hypothetical protein